MSRHGDHADVSVLGFVAELVAFWLVIGALLAAGIVYGLSFQP